MKLRMITLVAWGGLALACDKNEVAMPAVTPAPTPHPMPGMAVVDGHTLDLDGKGISGAVVTVAETGVQATSDADGHWQLTVGGNSTINLRVEAMGFARTIAPPMIPASDNASLGVDVVMVPAAKIDELNKVAGKGSDVAGVAAVQIRSRSAACDPEGGTVVLNPEGLGRVVYASGGVMEDPSLVAVKSGSPVAAWIAGMTTAGAYSSVTFQKEGCHQVALPVQDGALTYMGMVHVEPGTLSQVILFVE
jgi:hypothetical protein